MASSFLENFELPHKFREVHSVTGENLTKDVAVLVTSRNAERMSAADLNKYAREHWGIESKKHYIRDTV
jgi:hypothetical protein